MITELPMSRALTHIFLNIVPLSPLGTPKMYFTFK